MHWEHEEQGWEGSGAEESVLLELGLQSKVGEGTEWQKSPKVRLMLLFSTHILRKLDTLPM